jgi:hypothetical protein
VDYAGLFPSAALAMTDAVEEYRSCRAGADRWALGRFVVPAARLGEFGAAARDAGLLPATGTDPVGLSVLVGADLAEADEAIAAFHSAHQGDGVTVEAVECRAKDVDGVRAAASVFASQVECWVEVAPTDGIAEMLEEIAAAGAYPKIRMGGVEPDAFPAPDAVINLVAETVARGLPFKATAGLHHPLRGEYRYTYAADSDRGPMYGYLNLMLATALLQAGGSRPDAQALLLETDPAELDIQPDGLRWAEWRFSNAALHHARHAGMRAFGSCSFREPLSELSHMMMP